MSCSQIHVSFRIISCANFEEAVDLVTSMMRHDRHTRPTVREALQHPFFQTHNDKAGTFKRTSQSKSVNVDYIVCESTHNFFCPFLSICEISEIQSLWICRNLLCTAYDDFWEQCCRA